MTPFEQAATDHAGAIYAALIAAELANPSVDLSALHATLADAWAALKSHHPNVGVQPFDGTPKPPGSGPGGSGGG